MKIIKNLCCGSLVLSFVLTAPYTGDQAEVHFPQGTNVAIDTITSASVVPAFTCTIAANTIGEEPYLVDPRYVMDVGSKINLFV